MPHSAAAGRYHPRQMSTSSRTDIAQTHRPLRIHAKICLALIGTVLPLLAVEIGIRIHGHRAEQEKREQWVRAMTAALDQTPKEQAHLGHIIRPADHAGIVYQLRPSLDVHVYGARVTTNALGFRSPEIVVPKPPNTYRIIGIGDSYMFGLWVDDDECFPRVMERVLNERGGTSKTRIEIINTAVPGYNTAMEVAVLEHIAPKLQPDLVMIDFVCNDMDLPNFIGTRTDFSRLDHSFLLEWIVHSIGDKKNEFVALEFAPLNDDGRFEHDLERVPEPFRYMVGEAGYRRAMRRLHKLAKLHGFQVVVSASYDLRPSVPAACKELGFPLFHGRPACDKYLTKHGFKRFNGSPLTRSLTDQHPTALGHRILGEHYAALLLKSGLIHSRFTNTGLEADRDSVSIGARSTQTLTCDAGPEHANLRYLLLGTASGTRLGTPIGRKILPLHLDEYSRYLAMNPNTLIAGSSGRLDSQGRAIIKIAPPAGLESSVAGVTLHHAFLVYRDNPFACSFVSNAVPVTITK